MLHNTLQTNATQMTPQARGTAVGVFSSALYIGQTAGVAAGALVIDRFGAVPLFLGTAVALPALAVWFARELRRHRKSNEGADGAGSAPPHTLTSGTLGTEPRCGGGSLPRGPGGLRRGVERRFLARRGSGSFSGRGRHGAVGVIESEFAVAASPR